MFTSVDVLWTLWGAAMVFFMQAGFSLCEAGLTRLFDAADAQAL